MFCIVFFIVVRMRSGDFNHRIWVRIARFETMERRTFARTLLWRNNHIHDTLLAVYRKFRQISTMAERKGFPKSEIWTPFQRWNIREKKKNIYHTKNTIKQIWKWSGPFGLIWRKVTITLMFGLKLFLMKLSKDSGRALGSRRVTGKLPVASVLVPYRQ